MSKDKPAPSEGGINVGVAIVGFILCFLSGAGIMWVKDSRHPSTVSAGTDATAAWSDEESPIPISSRDPVWGRRDAPVTIVQFSDFQCPYCSKVELAMDQLKKEYGPEKLRFVWKNKPLSFHPDAKPAAEAAMGVFALKGSVGFWKFHDLAFRNQSALSATAYETWAEEAGVDPVTWKAGIAAHFGEGEDHPGCLRERDPRLRRAALREVEGRGRRGAGEGSGEDRERDAEGPRLRHPVQGEPGGCPERRERRR
jgi:hypothetical protein